MKTFKQFINEEASTNCKFFRRDNETCTIGCKKVNVIKGNICPYTSEDDNNCSCYKHK